MWLGRGGGCVEFFKGGLPKAVEGGRKAMVGALNRGLEGSKGVRAEVYWVVRFKF